mgnify:CR=1 FL=1
MAEVLVKHEAPCPACRSGKMCQRYTGYDGQGRADIRYVCDDCGNTIEQNEEDPRISNPAVGVLPANLAHLRRY